MKRIRLEKDRKKGQEEMVGFVVIVMIIVVVGVVFLAFSIRKPSSTTQRQQELADISWALLSYTSDCNVNTMPQSVWDLAKSCNVNNQQCDGDGGSVRTTCKALNDTVIGVLDALIGTNITLSDKFVHGYQFNFTGDHFPGSIPHGRLSIGNGTLSGNYFSYLTFIPSSNGDINVTTRFYYS